MRWARVTNLSNDGSDVSVSSTSVALRVKIRKASFTGTGTLDCDNFFKSSLLRQFLLLPTPQIGCSIFGLHGIMIMASFCVDCVEMQLIAKLAAMTLASRTLVKVQLLTPTYSHYIQISQQSLPLGATSQVSPRGHCPSAPSPCVRASYLTI